MLYGLVNVQLRIASIYTHDLVQRCDVIGCHNAELQKHIERVVISNDDSARRHDNSDWLKLTAD